MNIKNSLKRIWIFGSGLWIVLWIFGFTVSADLDIGWNVFWTGTGGFAIWWALYWGANLIFAKGLTKAEQPADYVLLRELECRRTVYWAQQIFRAWDAPRPGIE